MGIKTALHRRRSRQCSDVKLLLHLRRLCLRLMGILLPIVRGGSATGTGAADVSVAVAAAAVIAPYGLSNRLTIGLLGSDDSIGFVSVQSAGVGRAINPSTVAAGTTMLIRFSTFVSSSPCSRVTNVNARPAAPIRAVRPTRCT